MMFQKRTFALLFFLLAISAFAFCQDQFLDESDIIESSTFHCKGSGHGFDVSVKGDTVTLFELGKVVHYVNDSTQIFGNYNYGWDIWITFECDTVNDCGFWLSEDGQSSYKIHLLDTSISEFEYTLGGIEMGFFDRRFSPFIQKIDGVGHIKSE